MSSENSKINNEKKFKSAFKTCIISFTKFLRDFIHLSIWIS